jgi:hypothetical protein
VCHRRPTVGLKELDADVGGWKIIVRPPNASQTQFFWHRPPVGEYKLRVCLAAVIHTDDPGSEPCAITAMQHHPILRQNARTRFFLASILGFPLVETIDKESPLNTDISKSLCTNVIPENPVPRSNARTLAALANLIDQDPSALKGLGNFVARDS